MRTLMVSFVAPWPEDTGARIRAAETLRALATVGEVDLYCILDADRTWHGPPPPAELPAARVRVKVRPRPSARRRRADWMRPGGPPRRFAGWRGDLGPDLREWARGPYDLTWYVRAGAVAAVGGPGSTHAVVDLDDLGDVLAREQAAVATNTASRLLHRLDGRRWARLQRDLAGRVGAVGVCSELDRSRLGVANAVVLANGYEASGLPADLGRPAHDPPTLLLQGSLVRPPLTDAARALATEILPRVRRDLPSARLLLVGGAAPDVRSLALAGAVEVTGAVPEMAPWLEAADVVAVPMRWGSGTRIKILEAFAHGIPVVSSTIGAEGLDVRDGTHLLIADDPDDFAGACRRLLTDDGLRRSIAAAARERYDERYRWGPIRDGIGDLARRIAGGDRVGSR